MEEVTFKSLILYLCAESLLILPFAWIPSHFSLLLTYLSVLTGIVGPLCAVLAWQWKSTKLRLVFQLTLPGLFYLTLLRIWDRLMGLSWVFILLSLAGVVGVAILPYVNKRLSGILYREQMAPRTKIGQWILRLSLIVLPIAGAAGAALGLQGGKELMEDKFFLLFLAFLLYLPTLGLVFFVMFRHVNDLSLWKTRIK